MVFFLARASLCLQILSRSKPAAGAVGKSSEANQKDKKKKKLPKIEEFLHSRDYVGAITLLEVCVWVGGWPGGGESFKKRGGAIIWGH